MILNGTFEHRTRWGQVSALSQTEVVHSSEAENVFTN